MESQTWIFFYHWTLCEAIFQIKSRTFKSMFLVKSSRFPSLYPHTTSDILTFWIIGTELIWDIKILICTFLRYLHINYNNIMSEYQNHKQQTRMAIYGSSICIKHMHQIRSRKKYESNYAKSLSRKLISKKNLIELVFVKAQTKWR